MDYRRIGQKIKERRRALHITQESLAEKIDVSVGYISQVERGITKISLDLLDRLAAALDCEIVDFLADTTSRPQLFLAAEYAEKFARLSREQKELIVDLMDLQLKRKK
ncbi:MAG: helix-turn-helix transcriptional regulator [Clostridia bacterium]|nr:helix-turn-helix transcriptional regulator [Clostridia bacterium]